MSGRQKSERQPGAEGPGLILTALSGAGAGLLLAASDALATGALVSSLWERLELLLRLTLVVAPLGAAAGAVGAAAWIAGKRVLARFERRGASERGIRLLEPVGVSVILAIPAAIVAWLLFSGGAASRLAARPLLVGTAFVVLLVGTHVALLLASRLHAWSRLSRRRAHASFLGALLLTALLSRLNQVLFPGLYGYLHACLTVASFGTGLIAITSLRRPKAGGTKRSLATASRTSPGTSSGAAALALLAVAFLVNLLTVDRSPTVESVLLDPRASHTRTGILAMGPVLPGSRRAPEDAITRARRARARRSAALAGHALPTWDQAHVLLVTIDALRPDHLGLHGYPRATSPNLDRFASEAVVFERAYAQAPHSSYSLASLMTSEYLHERVETGGPLPEPTLASALGDAGHRTAGLFTMGIFHTEGERLQRYADTRFHFDDHDGRDLDATEITDAAIENYQEIARAGEPPSFTWVHYFDVHEPYRDTRFGRTDVDRYDSEIRRVDDELARLLSAVDETVEGELIVIVTADHGEEFREHGGVYHGFTLFEEQVRVPLLIRAPGLPATRIRAPVELVDVAPTVLGMVGAEVPASMRGDDLRALALGLISDTGPAFSGVGPKRMVVSGSEKLIANLRFGVYHLFDLEADPRELDNRASRDRPRLDALRGEIFAWLDGLESAPGTEDASDDPRTRALARARHGDRETVPVLVEVLADQNEVAALRAEAARLLGVMEAWGARDALAHRLGDPATDVRAEAAIALGRMRDERARETLRALVAEEGPRLSRAAVSLARLGDPAALAALPRAARDASDRRATNEAIRHLGRLGRGQADATLPVLRELLEDFDTRRAAVMSLGYLGDRRAVPELLDLLATEDHSTIRDAVVNALGRIGDPRAIEPLARLFGDEPALRYTAESLVRLGALSAGVVGGTDLSPTTTGLTGFGECETGDPDDPFDYLGRTHCETTEETASLSLAVPAAVADAPAEVELVIRAMRVEGTDALEVALSIDAVALGTITVDGTFREQRIRLPESLDEGAATLTLEAAARLSVDHALLCPRPVELARNATIRATPTLR